MQLQTAESIASEDQDSARITMQASDRFETVFDRMEAVEKAHLFNLPAFFRLHAHSRSLYAQLLERKNGACRAVIHFTEVGPGVFASPARGTFGGISADDGLSLEHLDYFYLQVEIALRARGARTLRIALAPASHDPSLFAVSFNLFSRAGYDVAGHDLNYDLDVSERTLSEGMDYGSRKRLNKCLREGWSAVLLDAERYASAYNLIAGNRLRKGFPLTMAFENILEMVRTFGSRVRFFGLTRESELAAAAICMEISKDVLYVFYWGDAENMQQHSPVAALAAGIYSHCQTQGIRLLDAGTSTVDGLPNHGLIEFKRGLGFRESLKLKLQKKLANCDA